MDSTQMFQIGAGEVVADQFFVMKVCKCCRLEWPLSMFYVSDGKYSSRCRRCHGLCLRTCRVCASDFLGRSNQSFCSSSCRKAHRPQTFKLCEHCQQPFGPVSHLSTRYCSVACKCAGQRKSEPKPRQRPVKRARVAHSMIARAIKTGKIQRPQACSECGIVGRIEAAHRDYDVPLEVRWLCRSCHAKWDWAQPKGGTLEGLSRRNSAGLTSVVPVRAENASI
jgi:hypothetical protein